MSAAIPRTLALCLAVGCTIDRTRPLEEYACEVGGACPDAGTAPDATPLAECDPIEPLPADGLVMGTTLGGVDSRAASCFAPGSPDRTYGFYLPGPVRDLRVLLQSGIYYPALHLYEERCDLEGLLACGAGYPAQINLKNVEAGRYAAVVDGFAGEGGSFEMVVRGTLDFDSPCDPQGGFLRCHLGRCTDLGQGPRCPRPLDCADGFDVDEDGAADEDQARCPSPPVVSCVDEGVGAPAGAQAYVAGNVTGGTAPVSRQWAVLAAPPGSEATPLPDDGERALFRPRLAGDYRLRHTVVDGDRQGVACEMVHRAEVYDGLRIELVWNIEGVGRTTQSDLDLHLLHPLATAWLDPVYDCSIYTSCPWQDFPWGASEDSWPFHEGDAFSRPGPEIISIYSPDDSPVGYRVGVLSIDATGAPPATAVVRIFCEGVELGRYTADVPPDRLWKVADVTLAGGCRATPIADAMGQPIFTPYEEAVMSR